MTELLRHIASGGIWSLFVLACGVAVFAANLLLILLARTRKPLVVSLALACLPLLVGMGGTALGYHQVRTVLEGLPAGTLDAEELEELAQAGYCTARVTTWLGAAVSAPLLLISLTALALKQPRQAAPGEPFQRGP
jgi:hypothetical protein